MNICQDFKVSKSLIPLQCQIGVQEHPGTLGRASSCNDVRGAPLSPATHEYLRAVLGVDLLQVIVVILIVVVVIVIVVVMIVIMVRVVVVIVIVVVVAHVVWLKV